MNPVPTRRISLRTVAHSAPQEALRIAVVAPPWYPVPPVGYGGIELVVALLVRELRRLGHHTVLFATEGSPGARGLAPAGWGHALGSLEGAFREQAYAGRVLSELRYNAGSFDIIHDHVGATCLVGLSLLDAGRLVHTVHGPIPEPIETVYQSLPGDALLIAISESQRAGAPDLPWLTVVHNAVDIDNLVVGGADTTEDYLLCLARICDAKGQRHAIEVARRTGLRLILAGKIEETPEAAEYHERYVAPAIDGDRVIHIENVCGAEKARLLSRARAYLAPLEWEEPFGLSMAEAEASGTPVIAFPRGAAPEIVVPGVTGALVHDTDEMVDAVRHVEDIDRLGCAESARRRFSPRVMAQNYVRAYRQMLGLETARSMTTSPALGSDPANA